MAAPRFTEILQRVANRAYVYARITENTNILAFFNRHQMTWSLSPSIQQGVFQYEIIAENDLYNQLACEIVNNGINCLLSRERLDTFNIISGDAPLNVFTMTFPITLG